MPTRTIDTQIFEGETIQCAKFVSDEPFSWKAAQIVQAECDYEFQMVAKSSVATTLKIQVGDVAKNQDITTDFTRFVIPFPSVTNDVDSLYITFPSGTYWLYNLQLERASTPSAWRPAPEDAEDYADKAAQQAVDDQTQLDVFNKLTNNGASQGIYLLDGQLYINGEYIAANTISGNKIHGGTISGTEIDIGDGTFVVDENGQVSAANLNMTGGSINIETAAAVASNKIVLANIYSAIDSRIEISPEHFYKKRNAYEIDINHWGIYATKTPEGESKKYGFVLAHEAGIPFFHLYNSDGTAAIRLNSGSPNVTIYDANGKKRAALSASGLSFYASDGTTRTCQYNPNGTITVP